MRLPASIALGVVLVVLLLQAIPAMQEGRVNAVSDGPWYLLLPLTAFAVGCWAFARERAQQEVQFSHAWPVSRGQMWLAKVLVSLLTVVMIHAVVVGIALVLPGEWLARHMRTYWLFAVPVPMIEQVAPVLVLLGLGLAMSTARPSPFDAAGAGLLVAGLLGVVLTLVFGDFIPSHRGPQLGFWPGDPYSSAAAIVWFAALFFAVCLGASAIAFIRTPALQHGRRQWLAVGSGLGLLLVAVLAFNAGLLVFGRPTAADIGEIVGPQMSPGGEWLAFSDLPPLPSDTAARLSWPNEPYRLWLMRSDGSGLRCVSRWPVREVGDWQHPRWLPFGWGPSRDPRSVLTARSRWVWTWDMQRMRVQKLPRLAGEPDESGVHCGLNVSPDGRYLYVDSLIPLEDWSTEHITPPPGAHFAGWGESRAYFDLTRSGREALWAATLPGGALQHVADAPGTGQWDAFVSPDERWTAWARSEAESGLVVTDRAGRVCGRFPDASVVEMTRGHGGPVWSPDGRFLWVLQSGESSEYWVIRVGEECRRTVVRPPERSMRLGSGMRWSPDGGRVAVMGSRRVSEDEARMLVLVARADGSELRRVVEVGSSGFGSLVLAGWLDDGRVLVSEGRARLVAVEPDTGGREVIFEVQ